MGEREDLAEQVARHRVRIRELDRDLEEICSERRVHKRIVALLEDGGLVDAALAVSRDPRLAEAAAADPERFCRERGIALPPDVTVHVEREPELRLALRHRGGIFGAELLWTAAGGFDGRVHVDRAELVAHRGRFREREA